MLAFGPLRECCMAYAVTTGSTLGPTSENVVQSWSPTPLSNLSYHNMAHATRLCNCARVYVISRNFAGFEGRVRGHPALLHCFLSPDGAYFDEQSGEF